MSSSAESVQMAMALTRYVVAAGITTAAVCACCSSSWGDIEIETQYVGHYGDRCYSLHDGLFEIRSSRTAVYYDVSESENGSLLTLKDQHSPKLYKLSAKTSRAIRFGIPVEVKEFRGFPNVPRKASLELAK